MAGERLDKARTPLDRLAEAHGPTAALTRLLNRREKTDPFALAATIERQLDELEARRKAETRPAAQTDKSLPLPVGEGKANQGGIAWPKVRRQMS